MFKKNIGKHNKGRLNIGWHNVGNGNIGDENRGDGNIGHLNTHNYNIGSQNYGNHNIGDNNTGDSNIGSYNIGSYNISNWNLCNYSLGSFNTEEQGVYLFNKPTCLTMGEWKASIAYTVLLSCPMSASVKRRQEWWDNLKVEDKNIILFIPHFDANIFKKITGIDVRLSIIK